MNFFLCVLIYKMIPIHVVFFLASCRIVCNSHVAVFIKNEKHERMLNGFFVACYEKLFKFIHRAKLCMQRLH